MDLTQLMIRGLVPPLLEMNEVECREAAKQFSHCFVDVDGDFQPVLPSVRPIYPFV